MRKLWNQDAANNNTKLGIGVKKKVEALICGQQISSITIWQLT
jgi:hypothetical protein